MKYAITFVLSFFTITSTYAMSYTCKNAQNQKLYIYQEPADQAFVILEKSPSTHQLFKGNFAYQDEELYAIYSYTLSANNGSAAQVVLNAQLIPGPGRCGRGGCYTPRTFGEKKAKLTIAGVTTDFDC